MPDNIQHRNLVNSADLRLKIHSKASEQGHPTSVLEWLERHFTKWITKSFDAVTPIVDVSELNQFFPDSIPNWAIAALDNPNVSLVSADFENEKLQTAFAKCIEALSSMLGSPKECKIQRMSALHILQRWEDDHKRFARISKIEKSLLSGDALRRLAEIDGLILSEFDARHPEMRAEMLRESQLMGHCLGHFLDIKNLEGGYGEHYVKACEEGKMRLFTLRTKEGHPHVTISARKSEDHDWVLSELKGKQNRPPVPKYNMACRNALRHLQIAHKDNYDALNSGLIFQDNNTYSIQELGPDQQIELLWYNWKLIDLIDTPTSFMFWIANRSVCDSSKVSSTPDGIAVMKAFIDPTTINKLPQSQDILKKIARGSAKIKAFSFEAKWSQGHNIRRL